MSASAAEDPRYPVGRFAFDGDRSRSAREPHIAVLAALPAQLAGAVRGLTPAQLETPYRDGGWTVRQVVHHVPDSHMNAYTRFKLALTEHTPTIKPYDQTAWALLEDSRSTAIETSLTLLEMLHDRWVRVLRAMTAADFARTLNHPENGLMNLDQLLATYDWHSRHHVAHIVNLRQRNGW